MAGPAYLGFAYFGPTYFGGNAPSAPSDPASSGRVPDFLPDFRHKEIELLDPIADHVHLAAVRLGTKGGIASGRARRR